MSNLAAQKKRGATFAPSKTGDKPSDNKPTD